MVDFSVEGFKMSGFKEMFETIDHLSKAVLKKNLSPMLAEALEPVRDMARSIAPDDPLTGPPWDLRASIETGTRSNAKRDKKGTGFVARAYVGPTRFGSPQAIMQEFGTVKMRASPYMRPAWDSMKYAAITIIQLRYGDFIIETARKYGPKGS